MVPREILFNTVAVRTLNGRKKEAQAACGAPIGWGFGKSDLLLA